MKKSLQILGKAAVYAFILTMIVQCYFWRVGQNRVGVDFKIYLEAARGNYGYTQEVASYEATYGFKPGWIYNNWLATAWRPFLLFNTEQHAFFAWYIIVSFSILYVTHKLLEVKYGFIALFAATSSIAYNLSSGNVYPLLVALSISSPLGALSAGLFKPQFYLALFVIPIFKGFGYWKSRHESKRRAIPSTVHLSDSETL